MPIICGTDLSPASAEALDVARAFALLRGESEVVLVHVADPAGNENVKEDVLDEARAALDDIARSRTGLPTVRTELLIGTPDETLLSFAETEDSNLIVISHRSTGNQSRLGTTASKVTVRAQVPVLLVRDAAPLLAFAAKQRALRVLLGVDESASCDVGIQWTHALRRLGPTEIILGGIYYPDDAAAHYGLHVQSMVDGDPEIEKLIARDLLRRFGDPVIGTSTGLIARPRRGLGRIGDHLIELARDEKADLIVVGTSHKTGLNRLGSVSSVIVNDAPQSIVVVPPHASLHTITIPQIRGALVATDFSQFANRAVAYAFTLTPPDGIVHIVHVAKDDAEINVPELERQLRALAPVGVTQTIVPQIVRGDEPAITLARCAARHGVDVICISSHGRSGIARALVGSVADQLIRATRLPVLVLRPA
jgi:nucleotide-binding universal stress UspA family protein